MRLLVQRPLAGMESSSQGQAWKTIAGHDIFGYLHLLAVVLLRGYLRVRGPGGMVVGASCGCRASETADAEEETEVSQGQGGCSRRETWGINRYDTGF